MPYLKAQDLVWTNCMTDPYLLTDIFLQMHVSFMPKKCIVPHVLLKHTLEKALHHLHLCKQVGARKMSTAFPMWEIGRSFHFLYPLLMHPVTIHSDYAFAWKITKPQTISKLLPPFQLCFWYLILPAWRPSLNTRCRLYIINNNTSNVGWSSWHKTSWFLFAPEFKD